MHIPPSSRERDMRPKTCTRKHPHIRYNAYGPRGLERAANNELFRGRYLPRYSRNTAPSGMPSKSEVHK